MPTPPLSDEKAQEALDAHNQFPTNKEAAASLGLNPHTFDSRLQVARARGMHLSAGARNAVNRAQLSGLEAGGGWIHDYDADGKKIGTTRWKAPEVAPETIAQDVRAVFEGLTPSAIPRGPAATLDHLCTVYPIMDVHYGMLAWGRETGAADYDIARADQDMRRAFGKLDALTPASKKAIVIIGGDFFHADDQTNRTPSGKHQLDTDSRHWKMLEKGIALVADILETLAQKHAEVVIRVLRGNHDPHAYMALAFALSQRFRLTDRVSVELNPRDLFMTQWGRCAIFAHHGDKAKAERLSLYISDVCPFWSETRHRHCLTGHIHHDSAKDVGPVRWESLRAFAPPDSYAAGMGYGARRALQSLTFDKQDGLVLRAIDPIEVPDGFAA